MLFIEYPKCTTCKKAKKWLEDNNISFVDRHIVDDNPGREELMNWQKLSGYPVKKFFNTSGLLYKEMNLKEKLNTMTEDEQFELLSSNGMLVKRPIVVCDDKVLVGFKEDAWKEALNK